MDAPSSCRSPVAEAPDDAWTTLRTQLAAEIDALLKTGSAVVNSAERPHLTLAYGIGEGDSGPIQSRLRRASDLRIPLLLDRVELAEVAQHARGYQWDSLVTLHLRTSSSEPARA